MKNFILICFAVLLIAGCEQNRELVEIKIIKKITEERARDWYIVEVVESGQRTWMFNELGEPGEQFFVPNNVINNYVPPKKEPEKTNIVLN